MFYLAARVKACKFLNHNFNALCCWALVGYFLFSLHITYTAGLVNLSHVTVGMLAIFMDVFVFVNVDLLIRQNFPMLH